MLIDRPLIFFFAWLCDEVAKSSLLAEHHRLYACFDSTRGEKDKDNQGTEDERRSKLTHVFDHGKARVTHPDVSQILLQGKEFSIRQVCDVDGPIGTKRGLCGTERLVHRKK
jgi:hypothetical protein